MKSCLKFSKHVETGFLVWWDPNESFCYVLGNHTAAVYSENTITSGKSAGGSIIILEKLFISRDGETGQGWGQNESSQIQSNPRRNLFLGRKFTIQHDDNPKHTSIALHEWFKIKNLNLFKWPSRPQDLNSIENLWPTWKLLFKISIWQKQFYQEEWA